VSFAGSSPLAPVFPIRIHSLPDATWRHESTEALHPHKFIAVIVTAAEQSVAYSDTGPTTHLLHRLYRSVAGRSRSQPVRTGTKYLLQRVIQGGSRPWRLRLYRPVTPEVAGSSPVAPVKVPANRHVVLSSQTPDRCRLHRLSPEASRNGQKQHQNVSGVVDFKPVQAGFRLATKAACNYTKRPARQSVASNAGEPSRPPSRKQ
jgi:hypothetical protein